MTNYDEQMDLFKLISDNTNFDIECYAFGGTAMLFYGYKDETKDIDLLFENEKQRSEFINALEKLGFKETTLVNVYIPEKLREKNAPKMFKRGENRFDLFVKKIFHTTLSPNMKEDLYAIHEFKSKYNFKVKVLRSEIIVLLKSVTERDRDFEDILTIIKKTRYFDWQCLIDEVKWQHKHGDKWVLLDVEKMMRELRKYVFIEQKYFRQL